MLTSIFLSHNWADKPFVRRLADDLESHGVKVWIDEGEIKVGDSLIEKIRDGIDNVEYLAAILSHDSVKSPWVQREIDVAMNQEIGGRKIKVLPIMYQKCDPPGFLLGKAYADFTNEDEYEKAFEILTRSIGIVFNKRALKKITGEPTLGDAVDRAMSRNLMLCSAPYHRPFQYIGLPVEDVLKKVKGEKNVGGNIIVENEYCRMFLEAEGSFISFVEIDMKQAGVFNQSSEFESEPLLGALSINPAELELARKKTHCHTYYDHRRRLKINVSCPHDGANLSVAFSAKYYGM